MEHTVAATIARAIGRGTHWTGESSREGPIEAEAQANTFETFTKSVIQSDGSAQITVARGSDADSRSQLVAINIAPESDREPEIVIEIGADFEKLDSSVRDGSKVEIWKRRPRADI